MITLKYYIIENCKQSKIYGNKDFLNLVLFVLN